MKTLLLDVAVAPMLVFPILALILILALCTGIVVAAVVLIKWILRRKDKKKDGEQ